MAWPDEAQAIALLDSTMEILPSVLQDVMKIGSVTVVDTARGTGAASSPSLLKNSVIGLMVGFLFACGLAVIYSLVMPKIRSEENLTALDLNVLGTI